jgi:hypothetical protein
MGISEEKINKKLGGLIIFTSKYIENLTIVLLMSE